MLVASVIHGECLEMLKRLPDCSVDSVVADPPYGLSFMGKKWDYDVPSVEVWAECLRVLKPGGHLLAFAGTRTQHRMAVRIEDAGFEIRDMIAWVYSSGFPKSHNLDNHRGEKICGCEPTTERDLRPLRVGDVPKAESVDEECREVLQSGVQEQGAPTAGRPQLPSTEDGTGQPGMEGRCDASKAPGELCSGSLYASADVGCADVESGRIRDGAPAGDGAVVRLPVDANGSCASRRPRPDKECATEPGVVAGQPKPQALGAWPVCRRCGLSVLPQGFGTALKPALEPITVARKPLAGTVAENVMAHGTGALNIDGCRVPTDDKLGGGAQSEDWRRKESNEGWKRPWMEDPAAVAAHAERTRGNVQKAEELGRWPANLIHDGSEEVLAAFPEAPGQLADASQNAEARKTQNTYGAMRRGRAGEPSAESDNEGAVGFKMKPGARRLDAGSAARFFYCAKASKADRDDGCDGIVKVSGGFVSNTSGQHMTRRDEGYQVAPRANNHPTVKPTNLMRYLCRLVTPPGGTVLDPFLGSGSTCRAAALEGFNSIGIEREAEYVKIARARIAAVGDVLVL